MIKIKIKNFTCLVFLNFFLCNNTSGNDNEKKESAVFQEHIKPYQEYWASEMAADLLPNVWNSQHLFNYVLETKGAEKLKEFKKKSFLIEDKISLLKENAFFDKVVLPSLEKQYPNKDKEIQVIQEINLKILDAEYKNKQEELNKLKIPEMTISEKFAQKKKEIEAMKSKINRFSSDKEAKKEAQIWQESVDAFNLDPSPENAEKLVLKFKEKYGAIESRYDAPNNIIHDYKAGNPEATKLIEKYADIMGERITEDMTIKKQIDLLQNTFQTSENKIAELQNNIDNLKNLAQKDVTHPTKESEINKEVKRLKETINNLEAYFKKQSYRFLTIAGSINACLLLFVGYIYYKKNHTYED